MNPERRAMLLIHLQGSRFELEQVYSAVSGTHSCLWGFLMMVGVGVESLLRMTQSPLGFEPLICFWPLLREFCLQNERA